MARNATGVIIAAMVIAPLLAAQQQATPHAGYVYPAGSRQGTSCEITVGGQYLKGTNNVYVSGTGVQASVAEYAPPLTPAQLTTLREQLKELMDKRAAALKQQQSAPQTNTRPANVAGLTSEEQKAAIEIREKIAESVRRQANPAIAESVTVHITVTPDATPGQRELRLLTAAGLTNPLAFWVGQLPEFSRKPAGVISAQAPPRVGALPNQPLTTAPQPPMEITLPATVNGQIMPGAVDGYRFEARKGQRLVIAVSARELVPYIADAVPGWFQAALTLRDPEGKEVAYADHYLFHPDPALYYEIPTDGQYTFDIQDSIYRGRDDFVYRISVGELPFVTGVFPLGGKAGARAKVELSGWNLPASRLTANEKGKAPGIEPIAVRSDEWISNSVPFALDAISESKEKEPNDEPRSAQRIKAPVIVNGRIDRPGDWDVFRLQGRAGEEIVAEVFARRLGSPLDSILRLTDAAGRELAANDDYADKGAGRLTHQADSRIEFKLPATGNYYLWLGDVQGKGGAEYAYRLRVSHPQPDFELRVVPSSINVRAGTSVPITVYALRKDGFAGDIALKLHDAPPGFTLDGGTIPANQENVRFTLTAPPGRSDKPYVLSLEGDAIIQGQHVQRHGIPADDMMQAFFYRHLVPAQALLVSVNWPGRGAVRWKSFGAERLKVPVGGTVQVQLVTPPRWKDQLQLALNQPPDGVSIQKVSPGAESVAMTLHADTGQVKAGEKGNLIVDAFLLREVTSGGRTVRQRQSLGTLPAIPFELVAAGTTR